MSTEEDIMCDTMSQKCVTHCVTRYAKVRYTFKVLRYISAK